MSKWVEVGIAMHKVIAVEIEDDETVEDAEKYAMEHLMDGSHIEVTDSTIAVNDAQAQSMKRNADEYLAL